MFLHRGNDLLRDEMDCFDEKEEGVRSGKDRLGVQGNGAVYEDGFLRSAEDLLCWTEDHFRAQEDLLDREQDLLASGALRPLIP